MAATSAQKEEKKKRGDKRDEREREISQLLHSFTTHLARGGEEEEEEFVESSGGELWHYPHPDFLKTANEGRKKNIPWLLKRERERKKDSSLPSYVPYIPPGVSVFVQGIYFLLAIADRQTDG